MFKEFEHIKIKGKDVTGIIVDIHTSGGKTNFIVESDEWDDTDDFGYPLYDCEEKDMILI